jgi:hypothetical protein
MMNPKGYERMQFLPNLRSSPEEAEERYQKHP